jgi:hypothetical protein
MTLKKETIVELQTLLKEDYGKDIDLKEATEIANGLVQHFDLLAKIYHREKEKTPKS